VNFFVLCFIRINATFIGPENACASERNTGALAEVGICEMVPEYTTVAYIQISSNLTCNSHPIVEVTVRDPERVVK
jgi:hypothetical protein